MSFLLIVSISFNLLLGGLLFFKSALNDILRDWWLEKRKKREEQRKRLVELRANLFKLKTSYPAMLTVLAIAEWKQDPAAKRQFVVAGTEFAKTIGPLLEEMKRNEVYFPPKLRIPLVALPTKLKDVTTRVLDLKPHNIPEVMATSELANTHLDEVVVIIEELLDI